MRSERLVFFLALHSQLLAHAAILQLHSILAHDRRALPDVDAIAVPDCSPAASLSRFHLNPAFAASRPERAQSIRLLPFGLRFSLSSYVCYLLVELLSLHERHPSIGSLPSFAASTPSQASAQPVMALWRQLLSYTDHLNSSGWQQTSQLATSCSWSSELGFRFCSSLELRQQQLIVQHYSELTAAEAQLDGQAEQSQADAAAAEMKEAFPCFYALLNLAVEAFLLREPLPSESPACSPALSGLPVLSVRLPSHVSLSALLDRCGHLQAKSASPAGVSSGLCARVEVVWEALLDCIVPAYSLPTLFPAADIASPALLELSFSCASYCLYDGPAPASLPEPLRVVHPLPADGPACCCRPHWSLLYLLLRVCLRHVDGESRELYCGIALDRLLELLHIWPCVDADGLLLQLHHMMGWDSADSPLYRLDRQRLQDSHRASQLELAQLSVFAPFLFTESPSVPLSPSVGASRWSRYLSLLFIYLSLLSGAQHSRAPGCLLSHNRVGQHRLLFLSSSHSLHVHSSIFLFFPHLGSSSTVGCDEHRQLAVAVQHAALYLLSALASREESSRAHLHLHKLLKAEGCCYHAQAFLLQCWTSLLQILVSHRESTTEAARQCGSLAALALQQLMDDEEEVEQQQCEAWEYPRHWTEEERFRHSARPADDEGGRAGSAGG